MEPRRGPNLALIIAGLSLAGVTTACLAIGGVLYFVSKRAPDVPESADTTMLSEPAEIYERSVQLRVRDPGAAWRLLTREEAAATTGNTAIDAEYAASDREQRASASIYVDRAYGDTLADVAAALGERVLREGGSSGTRWASVAGMEAVLGEWVDVGGTYRVHVEWLDRDHHYQIVYDAWGDDPTAAPLEAFLASIERVPGEVMTQPREFLRPDAAGPLWVIRDGEYVNLAVGVRLRAAPEWWLDTRPPDHAFAIERTVPELHVAVGGVEPDAAYVHAPTGWRRGEVEDGTDGFVSATVDGRTVELLRITEGGFVELTGLLPGGDGLVPITAWTRDPSAIDTHLPEALAMFDLLDGAEIERLERELSPDAYDIVTETEVFRRGVYRSFDLGLRWTQPGPGWRVALGDDAMRESFGMQMVATMPRRNITLAMSITDVEGGDLRANHLQLIEPMLVDIPLPPVRPFEHGGLAGVESELATPGESRRVIRSFMRDQRMVTIEVYHPTDDSAAAAEAARALEAMVTSDVAETTDDASGFSDRRLGFGVPAVGARFEVVPTDPLSRIVTAQSGLSLFDASASHEGPFATRSIDAAEDAMTHVDGEPSEVTRWQGTLGGWPARVVEWNDVYGWRRGYIAKRGYTIYTMQTEPRDGERRSSAWRWVDP